MGSTVANRIKHLKEKARETRASAELLLSSEARHGLLTVAESYERMADFLAKELEPARNDSSDRIAPNTPSKQKHNQSRRS